jgi:hypothetical protein
MHANADDISGSYIWKQVEVERVYKCTLTDTMIQYSPRSSIEPNGDHEHPSSKRHTVQQNKIKAID